jgi:pimeloyl-ACP methyl ester carboxylesterase
MVLSVEYDEFGLFDENIAEYGLSVGGIPRVVRLHVEVPTDGVDDPVRRVSALKWSTGSPEIVFIHGGAQNAHTWDTVALALGRPALAIDLPGHGHSDWASSGIYTPMSLADDIAVVIREHAPEARAVVGMSLGGLTSMELAVRHPSLVRSLVMVDITPGVNAKKAKAIIDFVDGPQSFLSFDDLLARTTEFNPTRSESSLRRGLQHNAKQQADGSWQWRYDRGSHARAENEPGPVDSSENVLSGLWVDFSAVGCPLMIVRGSLSPVVDDDDIAEAQKRQPDLELHLVDGAGHSVQGDRPVELTSILDSWLDR